MCDYGRTDPAKPFLLTSAGQYGTLLTDINLTIDPVCGRVLASSARNLIVQGESHVTAGSEEVHVKPKGGRIRAMSLHGTAIADHKPYRVTMNSYLATGGDRFTVFLQGTQPAGGSLDVDALATYLKSGAARNLPSLGRIARLD